MLAHGDLRGRQDIQSLYMVTREDEGKRIYPRCRPYSQGNLFLDMVPSSSADNVSTSIRWMFSWKMKVSVRMLELFI